MPGKLGALRLKVEELARSESEAATQAADLEALILLARGFSAPLGENSANNALKLLLKDAQVAQHHDRVVVTASLPAGFLATLQR